MANQRRQIRLPGMDGDESPAAAGTNLESSQPTAESAPLKEDARQTAPIKKSPPPKTDSATKANVDLKGKSVYAIDANSLIFQVFHAIPEMTSPQGDPVNAVFGFTRDVLNILSQKKPDYLFCAFDLSGPTFRHEMYTEYKGHREDMPEDLVPQIPLVREVLGALGVCLLEKEGFEADDLLATIATLAEEGGGSCVLVTADKDCRQLLSDHVSIYNVRKNVVYTAAELLEEWGVRPDQVVDFQALVGDSVDNVPGVPLIGPKAAKELLEKYQTLDQVLAHAHEVSGAKKKQSLVDNRDKALLSRDLVRLERNVPIDIDWTQGAAERVQITGAKEIFAQLGFHRLAEQARETTNSASAQWNANYETIDTPELLQSLIDRLQGNTRLSVDTETTSPRPTEADLVGISLAWAEGEACYLPLRGPIGDRVLKESSALEALRCLLEDPLVEKIGQNLKYDMITLRRAGIRLAGIKFDTMVASYLLEAGERNHNLDELAQRYLQHKNIPIEDLIGKGKKQRRMDEVPVSEVSQYAAEDADVPMRLLPLMEKQLADDELVYLMDQVEMPLVEILADMEYTGIRVDVKHLATLSQQFSDRIATLESEIYELTGHAFNIASQKQLAEVLFVEQKLPVVARTKTGPSTDAEVLEELAAVHPLPAKILEFRHYTKLKNTYVDALPTMVNRDTGRVHASFQQAVAATGRLSSSDPNLQNIPIRTEVGRAIRSAFCAGEPGWVLLSADYSQIELRVLAHLSRDPVLCEAFAADEDIHAAVASQVNGVPIGEVTKEMRRQAKAVNFGVIYGQSPFGLSKVLGIPQSEAAQFIDAYFRKYATVDEFLTKTLEGCLAKGYVKTILGRRRKIRGVRADAGRQRNLPERTAINTVIQGSAADLIKLAMISVHRGIMQQSLPARMLLQIHDELVFEVRSDALDALGNLVREKMSCAWPLSVPLKVDVKSGATWAETEPWK